MKWFGCFRLPLMALLLIFVSGCAIRGESLHGTVTEENHESANTFVIASWYGVIPRPAEGAWVCLHTTIVKTDDYGHFEVPGWWSLWHFYFVINRSANIYVYKPGFESVSGEGFMFWDGGKLSLIRPVRTPEEQLIALGFIAENGVSCSHGEDDADDPQHVMREYYQALADGVRQLGIQSKESERIAAMLKDKLYPQPHEEHEEQPMRIQIIRAPAPVGQAGVASAPLQGAAPAPASSAR